MTRSRPLRLRAQAYLIVIGSALALGILLVVTNDDSWDCDRARRCTPGLADQLTTVAYIAAFAALLCAAVETVWRFAERWRLHRYGDPRQPVFGLPSGRTRLLGYVIGVPAVAFLGSWIGIATYDCPPDASDCDLGAFAALGAAIVTSVGALALIIVVEIVLAVTRRRR